MTAEVTQEIGEKATDKVIKPLLGITVTPAAPMAGGLMGKLTDREGNILTADFFVSEGEKMVTISHADMEDVEVPMATDVEIDQTAVLEGLRKMRVFLASPAASDISADIRTRVIDLISMFDENLILIALEHHDRVQGFFHNNRLYLNRDLAANLAVLADFLGKLGQEQVSFDRMRKEGLLMDFLGLIHELGEGFVGLPTGEEFRALTRHTFMRGAGKDARSAYDALATEVGAESMNALTPLELIERLDAKMREPGFAISRERTMRLERGESPLTDSEKALILYNAGQDAVDALPFTGKALLFGVQDHLDPAGNARFTQDIRLITNDLRRGVLNVFLMPSPDIPGAEPGMAVVAKDARKTFRKKYGSNTRVDYYTKGEDFSRELDDLVNWAQSENEKKKGELFPKVFVYCTTPEDLRRVNDYLDTLPPDTQAQYRDMIMVGNDTEGEERAIVDEVKVIAVGAALMNDKRLADFGLSPEDLFESRKRLFNFLTTNDIIAEDISEDPAAYNKFLDDIWKGVVLLRITRVNWESIRDWKDAQDEVLRSL